MTNEEIFEKETKMCGQFYREKGGCNWGKCENCGVIPLLYKLYLGEIIEDADKVKEVKNNFFLN